MIIFAVQWINTVSDNRFLQAKKKNTSEKVSQIWPWVYTFVYVRARARGRARRVRVRVFVYVRTIFMRKEKRTRLVKDGTSNLEHQCNFNNLWVNNNTAKYILRRAPCIRDLVIVS